MFISAVLPRRLHPMLRWRRDVGMVCEDRGGNNRGKYKIKVRETRNSHQVKLRTKGVLTQAGLTNPRRVGFSPAMSILRCTTDEYLRIDPRRGRCRLVLASRRARAAQARAPRGGSGPSLRTATTRVEPVPADTVARAIGRRQKRLVVVGHSYGGFTAPLVTERRAADALVLVAGMIPTPGEAPKDYWKNTRHRQAVRKQAAGWRPDGSFGSVRAVLSRRAAEVG